MNALNGYNRTDEIHALRRRNGISALNHLPAPWPLDRASRGLRTYPRFLMFDSILLCGNSRTELNEWEKTAPELRIKNISVGGSCLQNWVEYYWRYMLAYPCSVIVHAHGGNFDFNITPLAFRDKYCELIERTLEVSNADIILQPILPILRGWENLRSVVEDYNSRIRRVAEAYQAAYPNRRIEYMDIPIDTAPQQSIFAADGVHFSKHGKYVYGYWFQRWMLDFYRRNGR
jgi:hypothetical protein